MQLCALDEKKNVIHTSAAKKGKNYFCISCGQKLRLRGGLYCRSHFYHLQTPLCCHARAKGIIHAQIQYKLNCLLPESQLEYFFSKVNRIADVVWWSNRIIFEIQCSNISVYEVESRIRDYEKCGFSVVWIFHEKRFNRKKVSLVEDFLKNTTFYFTDIDKEGKGIIYDQFSHHFNKKRMSCSKHFSVDLSQMYSYTNTIPRNFPDYIRLRLLNKRFFFDGDLVDLFLSNGFSLQNLKNYDDIPESLYHRFLDTIITSFFTCLFCIFSLK